MSDMLLRGTEIIPWANQNHTLLAPGSSLISEAAWRALVGEPVIGDDGQPMETFEQREVLYIASMGWTYLQ